MAELSGRDSTKKYSNFFCMMLNMNCQRLKLSYILLRSIRFVSYHAIILKSTVTSGYLLYERGSFKVLNGLLTELCLDVVSPEPFNHIDVGGEVPKGLDSNVTQKHQSTHR